MNGAHKSRPRLLRTGAVLTLAGMLASPLSVAQCQMLPFLEFSSQTHGMCRALRATRFMGLKSWDEIEAVPDRTLLVLVGRCDLSPIKGGLDQFIRNGGAALIASDGPIAIPDGLIKVCGHSVNGGKVLGWDDNAANRGDPNVAAGTDRRNVFDGSPEHVIVEPAPLLVDAAADRGNRPLRLVTRSPSFLEQQPGALPAGTTVIARFPPGCAYNGEYRPRGSLPPAFAVTTELEGGRLLMTADQDQLLNYFTLQPSTFSDNVDFLRNALVWLKQDRSLVLLVVDGKIQTDLDASLPGDPEPLQVMQSYLVQMVNQTLLDWQEEHHRRNLFNLEVVRAGSRDTGQAGPGVPARIPPHFYIILLSVLAAAAACFGYLKLRRASHRLEPGVPLLVNAIARHAPPLSTVQHRQRQALEEDNYGEYSRALAQEWLARVPGNPALRNDGIGPPAPPAAPPRVVAQGSWLRRLRLRNMVREVWELATDECPPRMSRRQFQSVLDRVVRLRDALAAGEVRLEW